VVNIYSGGYHGGIVNSTMFCMILDMTMTMGKGYAHFTQAALSR